VAYCNPLLEHSRGASEESNEKCYIRRVPAEIRALRILSQIGAKKDEGTGEWRRLHNEELYDLCSSPNIIRVIKLGRMKWAGNVERMGDGRGAYRILVGRLEGKRQFGRARRR
jgi:hypothetical protein